jgi:regulator of sigma E protease
MENSPAAEAGLQEGDLIVRAHGKEIDDFRDLQRVVALSANTPIDIVVQRAGERVTLTATPERRARPDAFGDEREIGYLGVGAAQGDQIQHERYGPFSAAGRATERTFELAGLQLRFLGRLITGRESVEELGGPLGIAHLSGRAASQSYEQAEQAPLGIANALLTLIQLTAAVSVSIGLINLFPIPILDGGHLLFYAYEAVRGRPVPPAVLEVGYRVGLALLLGVFLLATWSDLSRLGLFG